MSRRSYRKKLRGECRECSRPVAPTSEVRCEAHLAARALELVRARRRRAAERAAEDLARRFVAAVRAARVRASRA